MYSSLHIALINFSLLSPVRLGRARQIKVNIIMKSWNEWDFFKFRLNSSQVLYLFKSTVNRGNRRLHI